MFGGRNPVDTVLRLRETPHCRTSAGNRNSCFGNELKRVGLRGFEPPTSASRTQRSSQAELQPDSCSPDRAMGKLPSLLERTLGGKAGFACRFRRLDPDSCRPRCRSLRFQPLAGSLRLTLAIPPSAARTAWPRFVRLSHHPDRQTFGNEFPARPGARNVDGPRHRLSYLTD